MLASLGLITANVLPADAGPVAHVITTIAGGFGAGPATSTAMWQSGVAVSGSTLYVADRYGSVVRAVDRSTDAQHVVAGTGVTTYGGDGGPATEADIASMREIAVDGAGDLYITDGSHRIRKVDTTGRITTVAGTGQYGFSGDGGPATNARISDAWGVAVGPAGNLYFNDYANNRVRRVDLTGRITTVAGSGGYGYSGDGGPATGATFTGPRGLAVDDAGNLYIADTNNSRIRKVNPAGIITTFAGTGVEGFGGDGGPATQAKLSFAEGVAVDHHGNVYIAEGMNERVRKVDAAGIITTVAGNGTCAPPGQARGDGGPATDARLCLPEALAVASDDTLYIADSADKRVRAVDASGTISTVAGNGDNRYGGDGGPATGGQIDPYGFGVGCIPDDFGGPPLCFPPLVANIAIGPGGALYIADSINNRIRRVANGTISTAAGSALCCANTGDGGPATSAALSVPDGVTVAPDGSLYVADSGNNAIRKVDASGIIRTVAGTGGCGYTGDGQRAKKASLCDPQGLALDRSGNLYIADMSNNVIRRIDTSGRIGTVAGGGVLAVSGIPAILASLRFPTAVTVSATGTLYIADTGANRVWSLDGLGLIHLVAGTGKVGFGGDGGKATAAKLNAPAGLAVGRDGALYISDLGNNRVRRVDTNGIISTFAGTGVRGFAGDGGPASAARLGSPAGLAIGLGGNLFVLDVDAGRVRRVAV